jgi:hypothetical protein
MTPAIFSEDQFSASSAEFFSMCPEEGGEVRLQQRISMEHDVLRTMSNRLSGSMRFDFALRG